MQFYSENRTPKESEIASIVDTAMTYHIPIVAPDFIAASVKNLKLDYQPYLVFGVFYFLLKADTMQKESNEVIRESTLDKVLNE